MADTNHNIYLTLNFPGYDNEKFRDEVRAVRFTCEEEVNRPYTLKILFYIPGAVRPDDDSVFLDQAVALRVTNHTVGKDYDTRAMAGQQLPSAAGKYADASRRTFYGRVTECEHLGIFNSGDDEYHFYQILVRPNFHNTRSTSTIRTYMRPLDGNDTLTYSDVLQKAIDKYNANLDQNYYINKLTSGSMSKKDRFPVAVDFDGVKTDEDDTALTPGFAVQYNESYYNFILRILERQGWYYYFDFVAPEPNPNEETGGFRPSDLKYEPEIMRFRSRQTVERLGVKTTQFLDFARRTDSGLGIISKYEKRVAAVTQVTVLGYDPDTPNKPRAAVYPESDSSANPNSIIVSDNYFEDDSEGKKLARIRYEEYQGCERTFRIKANIPGAAPGLTFVLRSEAKVDEESADDLSGVWTADNDETMKYFIVSARHRGTSGAIEPFVMEILKDGDLTGEPTVPGYLVVMDCVPNRGVFRPQRSLPWSGLMGTVLASTLQVDTSTGSYAAVREDNTYFIKFKGGCTAVTDSAGAASELKFDEDGAVGPVRLQSPMTTGGAGVSTYMNAGTEVLVSFQEGDPNRPVILGPVPNADTTREIYLNAVETRMETGLSTRMVQDTESGNSGTDTGIGGSSTVSLDFQSGMSFANDKPTFSTSSPLALKSHTSAFSSSVGTYYNSLGTAAGVGVPTLFSALSEVRRFGVSVKKTVDAENQRKLDENKKRVEEHGKDAKLHDLGKKYNLPTLTVALNKLPTINGLLQMFMTLGNMQMQSHRVLVSAMPETANVNVRSEPNTPLSKVGNPLIFILRYLNDIDAFRAGIMKDMQVAKDNKEAMEKRKEADDKYQKEEKGELLKEGFNEEQLKNLRLEEKDYFSSAGYMSVSTGLDATAMVMEAWILTKLVLVSSTRRSLGNKGILLKASAGKVPKTSGLIPQMRAMGRGAFWGRRTPFGKYDENKGMEIKMEADGDIRAVSGGTITFEAYKGAATHPPTPPPTLDNQDKHQAILTLNRIDDVRGVHISQISSQADIVNMKGKVRIGIHSDYSVNIASGESYCSFSPDAVNLVAHKILTIDGGDVTTLRSRRVVYSEAPYHIFSLSGDHGGVLMGHYNSDYARIAGTPYITIGNPPAASLHLASANRELSDAQNDLQNATVEVQNAQDAIQRNDSAIEDLNRELENPDPLLNGPAQEARTTAIDQEKEALALANDALVEKIRTADVNGKTELVRVKQEALTNIQNDIVENHNIILGHGADNAKQEIKVSPTDISIKSEGDNGKVSIEAVNAIEVTLQNTQFKLTRDEVVAQQGNTTFKLGSESIDLG